MYNLFIKTSLLAVIAIFVLACKTTMQIERPKESYLPSNIPPAISDLPLPVSVDVKKLEIALNKQINGLLYEGNNLNNQDLSIKIWKTQNFTFSVKNNVIEYRVPLKIWSRIGWKVEKLGISVGDSYEANGSIVLNFKTVIGLDKNWNLVASTTSTGFQWIETPKLNAVGIAIPITPIANIALQRCEKLITSQIDTQLAQTADIKKYVTTAWAESQKPMQVNEQNDIWLRLTPKDIFVSPFVSSGNNLNIVITLFSQIETFMGTQPVQLKPTTLPAHKVAAKHPQDFNLNLAADITYDKITELAKSQLKDKTFSDGKKSITITDLSLFGCDGKPVFVADVVGSIKGRIYFTGNLVYNTEKNSVELQNPEFDLKTKNVLIKSASWLLNGMIIKKITPYFSYSVKNELEDLKTETNKMMLDYKIYKGITLNGKINSLTVKSLDMIPGALRLHSNLKGNVVIKVNDLSL